MASRNRFWGWIAFLRSEPFRALSADRSRNSIVINQSRHVVGFWSTFSHDSFAHRRSWRTFFAFRNLFSRLSKKKNFLLKHFPDGSGLSQETLSGGEAGDLKTSYFIKSSPTISPKIKKVLRQNFKTWIISFACNLCFPSKNFPRQKRNAMQQEKWKIEQKLSPSFGEKCTSRLHP